MLIMNVKNEFVKRYSIKTMSDEEYIQFCVPNGPEDDGFPIGKFYRCICGCDIITKPKSSDPYGEISYNSDNICKFKIGESGERLLRCVEQEFNYYMKCISLCLIKSDADDCPKLTRVYNPLQMIFREIASYEKKLKRDAILEKMRRGYLDVIPNDIWNEIKMYV